MVQLKHLVTGALSLRVLGTKKLELFYQQSGIIVMMDEVIRMRPLYKERVWGGQNLKRIYGRDLPDELASFGESWEIVDREEDQSVVIGGELDGRTLQELWTHHRETVFGEGLPETDRFPLLLKILDAREKLSLQVHPPENLAVELGGEAKTEMWFIAEAEPDAELYCGLKDGVNLEDFRDAIEDGSTAEKIHSMKVTKGDFLFVPSGRLHAIGGGIVIFEIQQNSDTTYRVHDWNRLGTDGFPRQLHVNEAMKCINFEDFEPGTGREDGESLVHCPYFKVDRLELNNSSPRPGSIDDQFAIISVLEGTLSCGGSDFEAGDFFIVPAKNEGPSLELLTESFAVVLRTIIPRKD